MRIARKLGLLAVMALAALALSATSASAVEVTEEEVGHCPEVVAPDHDEGSGGCLVHATSNAQVELASPAGMILCDNRFEARIDEAGAGFIYSKILENCNIPTVPCVETAGPEAWPVNLDTTTLLEADFCVDIGGGAVIARCHLDVDVAQVSHSVVNFTTGGTHRPCTQAGLAVLGSWTATADENHPEIEITAN